MASFNSDTAKREKNPELVKRLLKKIGYTKPVANLLDLWQFVLIDELGFTVTHEDIEKRIEQNKAIQYAAEQLNSREHTEFPIDREVAKIVKCQSCEKGKQPYGIMHPNILLTCVCCSGDYLNCLNCKSDEYAESYKRFQEANKPNEDVVDVGI